MTGDQNTKIRFENDQGGYRLATSVGGALTGEGAQIVVCDDPHNANEAESEAVRQGTLEWWDEALSTRLNDPKTGAFVVIMQRLHESDLTGHILAKQRKDWEHLMLPMRYEISRHSRTSIFNDPRKIEGELLCPERFGKREVADLENRMGPYAAAGQLAQRPEVRGGSIFKREWWQKLDESDTVNGKSAFPHCHYVIASVDTAYTTRDENDPSACTVFGCWTGPKGEPRVILMDAWEKRLPIHGAHDPRKEGELLIDFARRTSEHWGLVEWIAYTCERLKVDDLLVENKSVGISVGQEMRRLYFNAPWGVHLMDPKGQDKVSRAYAVQSLFADGRVYYPDRPFARMVIDQAAAFPKAAHDDLVDTVTQALSYLRRSGFAQRKEEYEDDDYRANLYKSPLKPIYKV
jgi:predicted phage terminase large subunit-like protein